MPRRRSSTTLTVLGILNLIAGSLGLIVTIFSLVGLIVIYGGGAVPSSGPLDGGAVQNHIRAVRPEYRFIEIIDFGIGFLFDGMLIVSGIGLLYRKKWARTLALIWAVSSFFKRLLMTGYTILAVVPTMRAYFDVTLAQMNLPPAQADPMKFGAALGGYGVGCASGILIAYPIIVFCLLLRKSSKAAVEPLPAAADEDYEDEYDDRRERFDDRPRRDDDRYGERDDRGRR